jgi:hypothetical protein
MMVYFAGKEANLEEKAKPEIIRQTVLNQHLKSLSLQCFFVFEQKEENDDDL